MEAAAEVARLREADEQRHRKARTVQHGELSEEEEFDNEEEHQYQMQLRVHLDEAQQQEDLLASLQHEASVANKAPVGGA